MKVSHGKIVKLTITNDICMKVSKSNCCDLEGDKPSASDNRNLKQKITHHIPVHHFDNHKTK